MKIATLFSGIGAPEKALKNLGIDYELSYFCEFDKYAIKSYCAIHNELESKNIGDITTVDINSLPKNLDLLVGGSPCQDFSLAGKRAGGEINSKTRSSLMWNFVEIIRETQPKAVLWENVTGALTKDNKANYDKFIAVLAAEGYKISAFTLNSKYFGIPQNRQRIFVLASKTHMIKKPIGYDCGIRLKDVLESDVDEKYYLSEKIIAGFMKHNKKHLEKGTGFLWRPKQNQEIADCITSRCFKQGATDNALIELTSGQSQGYRVYDSNGLAVTLASEAGGLGAKTGLYAVNKKQQLCNQLIKSGRVKPYDVIKHSYSESRMEGKREIMETENICPTLDTRSDCLGVTVPNKSLRIRKLTPKECFRLMGFSDTDYQKCKDKDISNSQLYKQAGNSIVVNVLMAIFGEYYGIEWQSKVYGKYHKIGQSQYADLPIMEGI